MARIDENAAAEFVTGVIQAAGGEISHNDLVQQLDTAGKSEYGTLLPYLRDRRVIKPFVRATGADSPAVLIYKLPSSS